MSNKNQVLKISKKPDEDKQFHYDLTELDKYLANGLKDYPKELARGFHELICAYADDVSQLGNEMSQGEDRFYVHREATAMIYQLEGLFQVLNELKENPERPQE